MSATEKVSYQRLVDSLSTSMGKHVKKFLNDNEVIELMVNPDGKLWVDRLGKGREYTGFDLLPFQVEQIIRLVASATDTTCHAKNPTLSAEIPGDGSRFQGVLPPVTAAPIFSIRKKALKVFTLDDYREQNIITQEQQDVIEKAVLDRLNILVVGGTGTGKTTLVNAIIHEIAKTKDRVILIEDTVEIQCSSEDFVAMRTQDNVSMDDLLRATLRLRPDRIIVGEVRGAEALSLLKAWNTGHPGGAATVHANSAQGGLERLEQMILEKVITPQCKLIAAAVNLIIYIEKYRNSRRVKEIAAVTGYDVAKQDYIIKNL